MSFTLVILQKDGTLNAISDKRLGQGSSWQGEILNWKWVYDDEVKIKEIEGNFYITGEV